MLPILQCRTPTDPATGLTRRQRDVLRCWRDTLLTHQHAPTLREVGAVLGIHSPNGVLNHVRALRAKGYLVRGPQPYRNRGDRLAGVRLCVSLTPDAPDPSRLRRLRRAVYERMLDRLVIEQSVPTFHELAAGLGGRWPMSCWQAMQALQALGYVHKAGTDTATPYRLAGVGLSLSYDDTDAGRRARLALED